MCREEIVINGCIGKCCEKFTLPLSLEDIQKMKDAYTNGFRSSVPLYTQKVEQKKIVCWNGVERWPAPEQELDKLLDMLIPLGITNIDPAREVPILELYGNSMNEEKTGFKESWIYDSLRPQFKIENGDLFTHTFTCRHFDTIERICTNYESRPNLCRSYGRGCKYSNCSFDSVLDRLMDERDEDRGLPKNLEEIN